VGAGLGLSIVRHIIQDLGGEINFSSEQGVGTEATVVLPLSTSSQPIDEISGLVTEARRFTTGKRFHLDGFDRYPDISETPTGILSSDFEAAMFLKSSIHSMLAEWFDMKPSAASVADKSCVDVLVIMDSGTHSLMEKLQSYKPNSGPSIVIVLCSTHPHTSAATTYGSLRVLYVSQPYVAVSIHDLSRVVLKIDAHHLQ
jgi:hypothetical protein